MTIELLVLAAAGGAFGASIGALPSFALAGLFVILGEVAEFTAGAAGASVPVDITGTIGFGVVLGPHVAFGGGAAALAYAARRGYADGIDPKAVTRGLGNRPDVLAVGGAFGIAGHVIATTSAGLSLPVDPVALGVVGSALLHRAVFGYHIVGGHTATLLPSTTRADGGPAVDDWLAYQNGWTEVGGLGLAMGLLGAYVAY